jgi:hypothetical protein
VPRSVFTLKQKPSVSQSSISSTWSATTSKHLFGKKSTAAFHGHGEHAEIYENLGVLRKNQRFFAPKNWGTCCFQKNLDVFWGNEVLLLMILSAVQKTKAAIGMLTSC